MLSESPSPIDSQEQLRLLKALRESELLRELSELLASSLDPTNILQVLVRRTTEVCEVKRCAVWLLDAKQEKFLPSAYHINTKNLKRKTFQIVDRTWHHSSLPFHHPIVERLLNENGLLLVEDLQAENNTIQPIAKDFFVRSVLLIALIRDDRPVGMMSLDNISATTVFTREQQQMARVIGQQAAVAIDHARLYQEAQEERKRAERLIERAQSIYEVAMAVNSGEELTTVLGIAAQHLTHSLEAKHTNITLLEHDVLMLAASEPTEKKEKPTSAKKKRLQHAQVFALPHCAEAIRTQTPQFITYNDLSAEELQLFQQLHMQQGLIIPLQMGTNANSKTFGKTHRCVGFAFVSYQQDGKRPSSDQLTFAQDIAVHCTMAIEKEQILIEAREAVSLATERANTLDAVFNAMTEGLIVLDLQGKVMISNEMASHFMGLTRNARQQLTTYLKQYPAYTLTGEILAQEDFPLTRALRGERVRGERFMNKGRDGREQAIEVNIVPLYDSKNAQIGIVSAFRDVTEQARGEKHIRLALETMLHVAEIVTSLTDLRTALYHVLERTLTALNCERGVIQLYDQTHKVFTPLLSVGFSLDEVDQWLAEREQNFRTNSYTSDIIQKQMQDGHATSLYQDGTEDTGNNHVLVTPIIHNKRLLGIIMLDREGSARVARKYKELEVSQQHVTTEFTLWDMAIVEGIAQFAALAIEQTRWQKEAETARIREETMRETNAMKDEFLAITAHEFRTPLTIILAHSQMMGRQIKRARKVISPLNERLHESIAIIEEQTRQLTNIVNTFLEVTRLNRGQIELTQTLLNLEDIIKEIVVNQQPTTAIHKIHYHVQKVERAYLLRGDKARLLQVFTNLIQNAIKYSPLGGPITITMQQMQQQDSKEKIIRIVIEDKGIGVPIDAQQHLFERFYRAPNSSNSARGVGLGLYVVAEFLHLHGGTICIESSGEPGEGSRFVLNLPLATENEEQGEL